MDVGNREISSILQQDPITVDMQDTVQMVEKTMEEHDVTSVAVIDADRRDCFGIISLKDIQHFHSMGRNSRAVRAWEMCTYKPLVVEAELDISDAAQLMVEHGIHHLVVTSKRKRVIGFISSLDLLRALMSEVNRHRRATDTPAPTAPPVKLI